jgi:hypothetical protein
MEPAEELTGVSLPKEITKQQFNKEPTESKFATKCPVIIIGDESSMGDPDDLP